MTPWNVDRRAFVARDRAGDVRAVRARASGPWIGVSLPAVGGSLGPEVGPRDDHLVVREARVALRVARRRRVAGVVEARVAGVVALASSWRTKMPLSMTATFTPAPALPWPPTWPHSVGAPICSGVANMSSWYGDIRRDGAARRFIVRTVAACLRVIFTARPLSTTW